jgi:hypothetical protein
MGIHERKQLFLRESRYVREFRRITARVVGAGIELAFRAIPRALGRRIAPADAWLHGPIGPDGSVGPNYYAVLAREEGLALVADDAEAGLLPNFAALRGPTFEPDRVAPAIRDFYEHTARYRLAVDAHWSPVFLPLGRLLVGTVSRRIAQLNFPLLAREAAGGMTSGVLRLSDPATGQTMFTGWLRSQPATGHPVYVGLYGIARPPGEPGPCVRVIFPLPHGSSTVLLRPSIAEDGAFRLDSDGRRFGEAGYYRIHQDRDGVRRARYVLALKESFRLWMEPDGRVHADHRVRFFRLPILRLRYVLSRIG